MSYLGSGEKGSLQDLAQTEVFKRMDYYSRQWQNQDRSMRGARGNYIMNNILSENPRVPRFVVEQVYKRWKNKQILKPVDPIKPSQSKKPPPPPPPSFSSGRGIGLFQFV